MKKLGLFILGLFILLSLIHGVLGEVRINEVELNPLGEDSGNEWVELYSDVEINLTGWTLEDSEENVLELNETFNGYYIIDNYIFLEDGVFFLYNDSGLIDEIDIMNDSVNDSKTWQYCEDNWTFVEMTKGSVNSCDEENINDSDEEEEISLDIDWEDDEIINGKEFEIKITAENLEDEEYDVKVWIEFEENDTIISDRYGEDSKGDDKWVSGTYYIYNLFNGPGDKTKDIELRIREDYGNFEGNAKIFFKIRGVTEIERDIEILEREEERPRESKKLIEESVDSEINSSLTGEVINLGNKAEKPIQEDVKTNEVIYESKNEVIKEYAVFGFALLCVSLSVLLVLNKLD